MKIEEKQALEIAKSFAKSEYEDTDWPLDLNDVSIKLSYGNWAGMSDPHWSVIISTKSTDPNVAVVDPDHVIVLVDQNTGRTEWFPVM